MRDHSQSTSVFTYYRNQVGKNASLQQGRSFSIPELHGRIQNFLTGEVRAGGMSVSVSVAGREAATPEHFENEDCERRNFWHSTSVHSDLCCNLVNPQPGFVPKLYNSL